MKKLLKVSTIILTVMILIAGCASSGNMPNSSAEIPTIMVSSTSISDGKLLTVTAADKKPNSPLGQNLSPAVRWEPVEGANFYAVVMFDDSADWLHFVVTDITATEIEEGKYTDKKIYVGPYPPKGSGVHDYRIEVFALKQQPSKAVGKLDYNESYRDIVKKLNKADGDSANILARGHIIGTYRNGDNTM